MPHFILLDRDGVINKRVANGYVTSSEQFAFLPGALDGLRLLADNDYGAIVVSNQAGVGKGRMTLSELEEVTRDFVDQVECHGGRIHSVYYCPHKEEDECACRKPKPGLLLQAQKDHGFRFAETFLIGDMESDLLTAHEVGCPSILINEGGRDECHNLPHSPRACFESLLEAARFLTSPHGVGRDLLSSPIKVAPGRGVQSPEH